MPDSPLDDRQRFETLLAPHRDRMRAAIYRLVGHRADAEDLVQEVTLKAFERLDSLRAEHAFGGWLMSIATRACLDHLRKQKRWRPFSQSYIEQECHAVPELLQQVVETTRAADYAFDVREHVSFCLTCVGRSLPPLQHAAIVLREVLGYSNREAADMLEVSESVLRHHLSDGRRAMDETFEGLCSLVNKKGVCRQCASFREVAAEPRRGLEVPDLSGAGDTQQSWSARLGIARAQHFVGGVSASIHDLLFAMIKRLEARDAP